MAYNRSRIDDYLKLQRMYLKRYKGYCAASSDELETTRLNLLHQAEAAMIHEVPVILRAEIEG